MKTLAVAVFALSCGAVFAADVAGAIEISPGDYIVTQESPAARRAQKSKTAGAAVFLVSKGQVRLIAEPPAVSGPRGIRDDGKGGFVFADPFAGAIKRLSRDGRLRTLARGGPLAAPKDVAVAPGGSLVVADFASFGSTTGGKILQLSLDGSVSVLFEGKPLVWPHGVAVEPDGSIVVADHHCCIYRLEPGGDIELVAKGAPLVSPQDMGLVINPKTGRADRRKSRNPARLLRVSPDGRVSTIKAQPRARYRAVALASDGSYLVVDMQAGEVLKIDRGGRSKVVVKGGPLTQPAGIVEVR
jgi:DNA-binding beta-propeller fold protein YncE